MGVSEGCTPTGTLRYACFALQRAVLLPGLPRAGDRCLGPVRSKARSGTGRPKDGSRTYGVGIGRFANRPYLMAELVQDRLVRVLVGHQDFGAVGERFRLTL